MKVSFRNKVRLVGIGLASLCVLAGCGGAPPAGPAPSPASNETSNAVNPSPCYIGGTAFDGGSGTQSDPYLVSTEAELSYIGCNENAFFKLTADIDFSKSQSPYPIYMSGGGLDGAGHTLSNLAQSGDSVGPALFFTLLNTTVQNLTLSHVQIEGTGSSGVGGLAVVSLSSTIQNCTVSGSVSGTFNAGGIVGYLYDSNLIDSTFTGSVVSQDPGSTDVSAGSDVGGLVGSSSGSTITHCSSEGNSSGSGNSVGGIVGAAYATTINTSFSTEAVSGGAFIGGLVGDANGSTINNSYATGSVTGGSDAGGLMGGSQSSTVNDCYSAGDVAQASNAGGLVGATGTTVTASYWDVDTSSQGSSAGGTGESTANLQTQSTFSGWDFTNTWQIHTGTYPTLR